MWTKKLLLRSKHIAKFKGKWIKPKELIKKATLYLNNIRSAKYRFSPEQIEEKALDPETGKYFQEVYNFHCLIKVKEKRDQRDRFDVKVDRCKKHLRDPLEVWEKVLVLTERLRKKDTPGRLYKSTTENKSFFNRDRTFIISERSKLNNNTYLSWLTENRELFALKNQFVK